MLADDDLMETATRRHLRRGVTDVLVFDYPALPGRTAGRAADLLVNVPCAVRESARYPTRSASRELALYVAHGLNHLTGASDATAAGRRAMRRRELRWLAEAEQRGLITGIVAETRIGGRVSRCRVAGETAACR